MRKSLWTMTALLGFTGIMLLNPEINPSQLGLGLGILLSPSAAANAMEHLSKKSVKP